MISTDALALMVTAVSILVGFFFQNRTLKSQLSLNAATAANETEESKLFREKTEAQRLANYEKQNQYIASLQAQYTEVQQQLAELTSKVMNGQVKISTLEVELEKETKLRRKAEEDRMLERQKRMQAEKEAEEANRLRIQEVNDWKDTVHTLENKVRDQQQEIDSLKIKIDILISKEKPSDV